MELQGQTSQRNNVMVVFVLFIFFFLVGCILFLLVKTPDVDAVLIDEVNRIQKDIEHKFNSEGVHIIKEKENLFNAEQKFTNEYNELIKKREETLKKISDPQRASDSGVTTWTNPKDVYYGQEGVKKFSIQEAPIGGASEKEEIKGYHGPLSLFYTCLHSYKCYVTQGDREHYKRNGLVAVDVGTNNKNIPVHVPDHKNKEVEYTAKYTYYERTTGATIELTGEADGVKFMWRIGHIHSLWDGIDYKATYDGKKVKTGDIIAISGGEVEKSFKNGGSQGATTGRHVHIEYLVWDGKEYVRVPYRINEQVTKSNPIIPVANAAELKEELKSNCKMFTVTAYYSPLPGQARYTTGSYAGDKRLNGNGTNGASGKEVFDGMIAAPKNYAFGTKIKFGDKVYQVEDRGGAIVTAGNRNQKHDRIDIWMGHGDEGLNKAMSWGKKDLEGCFVS